MRTGAEKGQGRETPVRTGAERYTGMSVTVCAGANKYSSSPLHHVALCTPRLLSLVIAAWISFLHYHGFFMHKYLKSFDVVVICVSQQRPTAYSRHIT